MANEQPPILCYVEGPWAYFTTQSLADQWGDDWNDVPYEHNAGHPYEPCWHRQQGECECEICQRDYHSDGSPKWRIIKLAWEGPFDLPHEGHNNSPWSVQAINRGDVAWLRPDRWRTADGAATPIHAGTQIEDFVRRVIAAGGRVYLPKED